MPRMSALSSRPLLVFALVVAAGIGIWAVATILIQPNPVFVSERACSDESGFNCVTLNVPRDHFASESDTWEVTFAIQRALSGDSEGVIVYAVGGPGASGIAVADDYASYFDPDVPERYDLVFFDQRGIGRSQPFQCLEASLAWFTSPAIATGSEAEAEAFSDATEQYVTDCLDETGAPPEDVLLYATRQAVEDLEVFRQWHGAEQLIVIGESYGTQYGQGYAAAHPERVEALIIDGPIDLTLSGHDYYVEVTETGDEVLSLILDACSDDPACEADMGGRDALAVYDELAADLRDGPMTFDFVTAEGEAESRELTFNDLETVGSYLLSPQGDRMFLQRALAQASRGELLPLARILYAALAQDPETLEPIPDDTWSDALYYAVDCGDYAFGTGSAEERSDGYFAAGEAAGVSDMRLGTGYFIDYPCAYWPSHPPDERPPYLGDTEFPILILGATWDPYTPYPNAERLAANLGNSYAITQPGGPHVIGLRGEACPDDYLNAFLLEGTLPPEEYTECEFAGVDPYVPIPAADVDDYGTTLDALSAVDDEINYSTDFTYWGGVEPLTYGCLFGGTITYTSSDVGYDVALDSCAFSEGLALTGEATIDDEEGTFSLAAEADGGGALTYERDADGGQDASGDLP